jgi:hypothetical protein
MEYSKKKIYEIWYMEYEVLSEISPTVIVVIASMNKNESAGQGHTSTSLLHQSVT